MRRTLALLLTLAVVLPASAFDSRKPGSAVRITVLQAPLYGDYEDRVAARVRHQLVAELRERGFDAVNGRMSFEDLIRGQRGDADLYVEIAPAEDYARPVGGVGVNVPNATVDVSVIVSRVAAELRIYDGRTLNLIGKRHLRHTSTSIVPTGVGVGTYRMSVWFALPFVDYMRYRSAVNHVVEDAVKEIAGVAR